MGLFSREFGTLFVFLVVLFPVSSIHTGASELGSSTPSPTDIGEDLIEDMILQIDEEMVYEYHHNLMRFGARYTGSINCSLASLYLYEAFQKMNLPVSFHEWEYDGFHSRNVIATLEGVDPNSHGYYILSAHYDCTPGSLGADDDGSGVAAVLAIADIMSDYQFDHTVKFILFSGEEVGTYGSFCYARDSYRNQEDIIAVINLDMVGYANTSEGGNILRFFPPKRSEWIADYAQEISEQYYHILNLSIEKLPNYIGADHYPFINYGYDGVWIAHHDGYPWGNSPEDTPDHLNWTYQVKATRFMLAYMAELASKPLDVLVFIRTPYEGKGYFFNRPVLTTDYGRLWYQELRGVTLILGRPIASAEVYPQEDVKYVIFCLDDNFMMWDNEAPYEWRIQGKHYPPIGRHILRVYAYTTSGNVAVDEMDIIIFTLSSQYGRF